MLTRRPLGSGALGAVVITFSAIFVRLADVSPATAAVFRCAYALPALGALAWLERRRFGLRPLRDRLPLFGVGIIFAADLIFWHYSIKFVGAGLATVLASAQVVLVGLLAWAVLGERPDRRSIVAVPVVLVGVVLISGAIGAGAYGENPALGVTFGLIAAFTYATFLIVLRNGNTDLRRPAGPLFDATLTGAIFSAIGGLALGDVDFAPGLESQAWLALLALTSQVIGWLLISVSLPRLPALTTSIVLLIQPVAGVFLSALLLSEAPSAVQLTGVAVVLLGVTAATTRQRAATPGAAG